MKAPKCRLCGEEHPTGRTCPKFAGTYRKVGREIRESVGAGEPPLFKAAPLKYDRNAAHRIYMKKYMRKKRAADKTERLLRSMNDVMRKPL